MGPEATVRLFDLIVQCTNAESDQAHIPIMIVNNPKVPDRTVHIVSGGPSPLPLLVEGAKKLEKAGADIIIMPCHTAHHYYSDIIPHIGIPFLHIQQETRHYVEWKYKELKRFGLLATTGTVNTGLFQNIFYEKELEVIEPGEEEQEIVMAAIYGEKGIKAGFKEEPRHLLMNVIRQLKEQKAEAIIAGCTEISLVLNPLEDLLPVIDPLQIIAQAAILKAGYQLK
ncbi:MAG: aspartate/glutamate racemase family protein [bacterium]|nr:aspartate/glutamate racemase family protein [bacterium]